MGILVAVTEVLTLAVKENENFVFKYGQEVAELVAVFLKGIGVTPKLQERALTEAGEKPLCRCHAF
jgi:uncharacterized protein YgfB (UPF0149 family)